MDGHGYQYFEMNIAEFFPDAGLAATRQSSAPKAAIYPAGGKTRYSRNGPGGT